MSSTCWPLKLEQNIDHHVYFDWQMKIQPNLALLKLLISFHRSLIITAYLQYTKHEITA